MYRLDFNHLVVKRAIKDAGRPVYDAGKLGSGLSDLISQHVDGRIVFIEVKRPGPPSARTLTPAEEKFRALWPDSYVIVQSPEEALRAVGVVPLVPIT